MREFVSAAFLRVGVEIVWQGSGVNEVGVDARGVLGEAGRVLVAVDISCVPQRHSADARSDTHHSEARSVSPERDDTGGAEAGAVPARWRPGHNPSDCCSAMHPGYVVKNFFE